MIRLREEKQSHRVSLDMQKDFKVKRGPVLYEILYRRMLTPRHHAGPASCLSFQETTNDKGRALSAPWQEGGGSRGKFQRKSIVRPPLPPQAAFARISPQERYEGC